MSDEVIEGCPFHKTHDMHCANCTSQMRSQATRIKALEKLIERAQETTEKWLGFASKAKKERDAALAEVAVLKEIIAPLKEAALTAHRYFGAQEKTYACDEGVCRSSAVHWNKKALAALDALRKREG